MLQQNDRRRQPPEHLLGVLRTLWQWRKPIILTTLAGIVLAVIISLLLPAYYTGETSFVAISPEQLSIESTFGSSGNRIQFYGTGDDIDRMLSIAESNEVIDYMVDNFKLYEVYDIDTTAAKAPLYVRREFMNLYDVERTPRDIIELSIQDKNPQRAAAMATAARQRIDAVNLALIRATHLRNAASLREEVTERERTLNQLNDSLAVLREQSGVYNTESQSETLSAASATLDQQLATTQARLEAFQERRGRGSSDSIAKLSIDLIGLQRTREALNEQLEKMNASISRIENLEEERLQANERVGLDRTRMRQYEAVLSLERRTLEVIEEAQVPVAKSWPIRWLMVVGAAIVSFIFAVVGVLLLENGRRYDWGSIVR